ncbi:MAG: hypothetical protein LBC87_04075 [Fibromonadaceae bacterium]|nr:hypothetical protein [Fibromonadaceae bacterium]
MSTKTAIDLATLGASENDSEGVDCYISEKGIQAAPAKVRELEGSAGVGKYHATMYMNGITYYIFERKIFNEKLEAVKARYGYFDKPNLNFLEYGSGEERERIPTNYFKFDNERVDAKRPIKTISYMTLTNKTLQFFNITEMNTIDFEVSNNILALFNCNVLAFMAEREGNNPPVLTFIKNPLFATKTPDDITNKFPMGILSLRSWSPVWMKYHYKNTNAYLYKRVVDIRRDAKPVDFTVLLSEESVFIYDKNTGEILALRQIRRRTKMDDDYPYVAYLNDNSQLGKHTTDWKAIMDIDNTDRPMVYLEYVNHLYLFNTEYIESGLGQNDNAYGMEWKNSQTSGNIIISSKLTNENGGTFPHSVTFYEPLPFLVTVPVSATSSYRIPFCQVQIGKDAGGATFHYGKFKIPERILGDFEIHSFYQGKSELRPSEFRKGDNIDYIKEKINSTVEFMTATPDEWSHVLPGGEFKTFYSLNSAFAKEDFIVSPMLRVYEINGDAVLNGTSLSYHTQDYLWGQRSRAFSIGTRLYTNVNPYIKTNKSEEITIQKFREQNIIGNDLGKLPTAVIKGLAKNELAARTLKLRDQQGNLRILSLPKQDMEEVTVEYKNAVYYTDIGSFNITPENNQYEVPSNISDKIIGLWGEDRDILFISSKSIERFNIADSIDVPLSFVRLEKTYDLLVDWSGINKRLDLLTKEKGAIQLNGEKRIRVIFDENSRIAPDTVWKTTDLRIIENIDCFYAIDSQNRAFRQEINAAIFSLTDSGTENSEPILAGDSAMHLCKWESDKRFSVEWTYRNERNILLSEITIRMALFNVAMAMKKRTIDLYKDDILIRSRDTSNATVNFYKFGRGLSSKFKIKLQGYLREVMLTDTEGWQK